MAGSRGRKSQEPYQELDEVRGAELNSAIGEPVGNGPPTDIGLDRSLELTSVPVIPDGTLHFCRAGDIPCVNPVV